MLNKGANLYLVGQLNECVSAIFLNPMEAFFKESEKESELILKNVIFELKFA